MVALADTRAYVFDHQAHMADIGRILSQHSNAVLEIANEPNHATQLGVVADPDYLADLRALVPGSIPVALGAAHGPDDEADTYFGGDYVTVHINRAGGDDGWRWVRHAREIQAGRERNHHKFVVNDEPDRKVPAADQHLALGLLMRMYGIGDTVHLGGLRFDTIPSGDELVAFNARKLAWQAVPDDWSNGRYTAAHLADSPVRVDSKVLRAYSSLRGNTGLTLLIKVEPGAVITWQNGWTPTLVVAMGKTQLYSVRK